MQSILDKMKKGIDMNLLAFWSPDQIYNSDSCPAGLGSYSDQGFAWGFAIPDDLLFRASNNLLEFLAAVITPWIDIIHGHLTAGDCALSMTDSTTAEGWMRKSNFVEPNEHPVQAKTRVDAVRKYASIFMDADIKGYSQWFAHMWYRPFGNRADRIPLKTQTTCLVSFYQGSPGPIETTIPKKCNKRPFLSFSSKN